MIHAAKLSYDEIVIQKLFLAINLAKKIGNLSHTETNPFSSSFRLSTNLKPLIRYPAENSSRYHVSNLKVSHITDIRPKIRPVIRYLAGKSVRPNLKFTFEQTPDIRPDIHPTEYSMGRYPVYPFRMF